MNDSISATLGTPGNVTVKMYDPTYYSTPYQVVGATFHIIIFLVGVFGNAMVVIVVKRTRSMHSTTNCYLVSLAIADFLVLVSAMPNEVIGYFLLVNEWIWGRVGCAVFVFLQYLGINASSLSITAFTIERYIAICHPIRAHYMCTMERAKKILLGVWIFACCYCSPWLGLTTTRPVHFRGYTNIVKCTFQVSREKYLAYYMTDFILFYVIPLLMSIVIYTLIIKELLVGMHSVEEHETSKSCKKASASRVQVIKMLVLVVCMFAVLWMPYRFLVVYNSFAKEPYLDNWFLMFCKTMVFINSAVNPILYSAMSMKFRQAFKCLLTCTHEPRSQFHSMTTRSTSQYSSVKPPKPESSPC